MKNLFSIYSNPQMLIIGASLAIGGNLLISVSMNIQVRSYKTCPDHETIYCPLARGQAQVTIQPGRRQYGDAP